MIATRPSTPILALSAAFAALASTAPAANAATTSLGADPATACAALLQAGFGALEIDSSVLQKPYPITVAEKGPTPASRVSPANPAFCEVLGRIEPVEPEHAADSLRAQSAGRMERPRAAIRRRRI